MTPMNAPTASSASAKSPATRPVGIAICGAGAISRRHAGTIAASDRAVLRWVCDPQQAAGEKLAQEFKSQWADSIDHALKDPQVDIVYVCVPNFLHHELAIRALAAGKHVFVEKPIANTPQLARQVIDAARKHQRSVVVGHQYRHLTGYRRLRQLIDDGAIGQVRCVVDRILANYRVDVRPAWFLKQETAGGGVLMNNGVHQIDRIFWLLGEQSASVTARIGRHFPGYDIDSDVHAFFTLPSGRTAELLLAGYPCRVENSTEVIGTTGQIRIEHTGKLQLLRDAQPEIEEMLLDTTQGAPILLNDLIRIVDGHPAPATDAPWGAFVVDAAYAIYEAAKTGQAVQIG